MKRLLLALGMTTLALSGGCVDPATIGFNPISAGGAAKAPTGQRPPTVNADQVNENNANAMARALQAEIEFDARRDDAKTPPLKQAN